MTEIHAYFDGAFIWGDNHCGYGALVKRGREILFSEYKYVGNGSKMSVNVAEYSGLIAVLKFLISAEISEPVLVRGDSKLVILNSSPVVSLECFLVSNCQTSNTAGYHESTMERPTN